MTWFFSSFFSFSSRRRHTRFDCDWSSDVCSSDLDRLTIRDSISLPIKSQTLLLGVEHDRVNPSLISKLNQELSLLSPALQAEFLANPSEIGRASCRERV